MGENTLETIDISGMDDAALQKFLQSESISLKLDEARKIVDLLGRNPTITELHIFNIQWSEHSSYKSSRAVLKTLPTEAPNVILGPVEDSGIIKFGEYKGDTYGIVVSHESHNHPSQVVPYEGAATGVGGILRDVLCMGSEVIATADPLRFGNPNGPNKKKVQYIAQEVVNGIAGYGNAVGIPNIAGDVYANDSFDDNCLVNVVCLGLIKEQDVIHSYAPESAAGYDIILVGKATDISGFGGAAFASLTLDEDEQDSNRGAVQVPDPFLKNILIRATYDVFKEIRKQNISIGFKDLGAGGIMCASSELCDDAGFGAKLNLDNVNVGMDNLPGHVIACSETQERFMWICPKEFSQTILKIYNEDFELPRIAIGAKATIIGEVTDDKKYVVSYQGKTLSDAPISAITKGIKYEREQKEAEGPKDDVTLPEPDSYNDIILDILKLPHIASKASIYKHYDTNVMGNTVIASGQADAGLLAPIQGSSLGVALKADCNPRLNRISPYWGAAHAVAEAMRNVAAIGATPSALTDCLNYGNPEKPESFSQFVKGVQGVKDAAEKITMKGASHPVPIVSGNVSFYNESKQSKTVDPSPVVACVGIIDDVSKAVTMKIKKAGSTLILVGNRSDAMGGSAFYEIHKQLGANIPEVNFEEEKNMMHAVIDLIDKRLVDACHDISEGGLAVTVAEMIMGGEADGAVGAHLSLDFTNLSPTFSLLSENAGFVVELKQGCEEEAKKVLDSYKVPAHILGTTGGDFLECEKSDLSVVKLSIDQMKQAWCNGFDEAFR